MMKFNYYFLIFLTLISYNLSGQKKEKISYKADELKFRRIDKEPVRKLIGNVTFKQGNFLAYKPLQDFVKMAKAKSVSKETIVFNNLVDNMADYRQFWEVPASESWHIRFIK